MPTRGVVIDGSRRAQFEGVEVVRGTDLILMCGWGRSWSVCHGGGCWPGTTIAREGDRGRLVLAYEVALNLGRI